MQPSSEPINRPGTVSDLLDRLEITAGKAGLITRDQAYSLLNGLDEAYNRLQELEPETQSRMVAETQFESIVAQITREAGQFVRDLGGAAAMQSARERRQPPASHKWWFLDQHVADQRRTALRRAMTIGGIVLVLLIGFIIVYQSFLAPDPQVAAVYSHQQQAQDFLMNGNMDMALEEVNAGLAISPRDPTLLITRGVILEKLGRGDEAQQAFATAEKEIATREEYLTTRSQAYLMNNQPEKALADAQQASQANPDYAQAYLMAGQAYEILRNYPNAMDTYEKAFTAAEKSEQLELAAITRTRMAMLLQMMNAQMPLQEVTPTAEQ
jgi:tetratricopeptide (TPR) repeat protein